MAARRGGENTLKSWTKDLNQECMESRNTTIKNTDKPISKWAKNYNTHFSKEFFKVVNNHM